MPCILGSTGKHGQHANWGHEDRTACVALCVDLIEPDVQMQLLFCTSSAQFIYVVVAWIKSEFIFK